MDIAWEFGVITFLFNFILFLHDSFQLETASGQTNFGTLPSPGLNFSVEKSFIIQDFQKYLEF